MHFSQDVNETLKINMTDMVERFLEKARHFFNQAHTVESEYNATIELLVANACSSRSEEKEIWSPFLAELCADKDVLRNHLASTIDAHSQV